MKEVFEREAMMSNAYGMKKQFGDEPVERDVHRVLDHDGVIMTDSAAYEILTYGCVKTAPEEVIKYQEEIDTDIATILGLPIGQKVSKEHARHTVDETLERRRG